MPVPVIEARYSGLRAVKGGLAWRRAQVTGVLGEGGADLDDDAPRPVLERYDLRKREVTEIAREIDWFDVSGDGTRLVVHDRDELRVMPSSGKRDDAAETVTVNKSRARFQADPAALWRHAYAEAGRIMRRDFWVPDMSGVDWDGVLESYRPLLDRIRGSADFADLLWEVLGETGTSHSYVQQAPGAAPKHPPVGQLGADLSRDGSGRWLVDRVLPGESSDPRARSPLAAPGVAVRPGDRGGGGGRAAGRPGARAVAAAGRHRGPAGRAHRPARRRRPGERRSSWVPLRNERRLRYQDWVAGRRALVRELSQGRLGYLHIPDMMGEGWAHFHRDLRTEMGRDGLIFDVRANNGGHISQLVVEKLARRVIAWGLGRWQRPETYPLEARRGPMVTVADEFAGSDGDIVTAAIRLLGLGPVVGTRTWGGVIGIEGYQELVDGTSITVPQYAFSFIDFGWDVENYGVDPDVEVLNTPDDWAAGRDAQLETAVQLALEALDKQPPRSPRTRPPARSRPARRCRPGPMASGVSCAAGEGHGYAHADHGQPADAADHLHRRGERANQARTALAANPQEQSETAPIVTETSASSSICCGTCPAERLTNCGRIAPNRMYAFGLVRPTTAPSSAARQPPFGSPATSMAAASCLRRRIAWTPSQTRYSAPAIFTIRNTWTERSSSDRARRPRRPPPRSCPRRGRGGGQRGPAAVRQGPTHRTAPPARGRRSAPATPARSPAAARRNQEITPPPASSEDPSFTQLSHRTHAEQLHGPLELRGQDVQRLVHPRLPARHQAVQVRTPDGAGVRAERERHRDVRAVPDPGVDQHGHVRPDRLADRGDRADRRYRAVQLAPAVVGQLHAVRARPRRRAGHPRARAGP